MSECNWCGETLDNEEKENPRHSKTGEIICDECYEDEYMDRCGYCTEIVEKTELHHFLFRQEFVDDMSNVPDGAGIYKPTRKPFYYGSILADEGFFPNSIEKVAEIPEDYEPAGRYIDWICDKCMSNLSKERRT